MVVVMSHIHVNDHVYMKIPLLGLYKGGQKQIQFAVLPQSPRHGLGLGTATHWPVRRDPSGLCVL